MNQEGYCLTGRGDEPLDENGFCLPHHDLAIPPTYGNRLQRWVDGAWSPHVEKKSGCVYVSKTWASDAKHEPARDCAWCFKPLAGATKGPSKQLYCGKVCRDRAQNARRLDREREAVAS